jgi:hypothetical protein
MTSFRGEVKSFVPCHKILRHVKQQHRYGRDTSQAKFMTFLAKFMLLHCHMSAGNCQRALVDKSGMIRTQMGAHNRSEIVTVHFTPCAIQPHKSNSNSNHDSDSKDYVRFQVLMVVSMKMAAFWDIVPCCLMETDVSD